MFTIFTADTVKTQQR